LLVLNDLDRDGRLLSESEERQVLNRIAQAGHRAAGVRAPPPGGSPGSPGAWPKRVLVYGRRVDSPCTRPSSKREGQL
jgi:hypothetical protein